MRAVGTLRVVCGVLVLGATLWLLGPPVEAQRVRKYGLSGKQVPERTDAGNWHGTWYYVSRDFKLAMWIRHEGEVPEVMLRFLSLAAPEGFQTDWAGQAEYPVRTGSGTFRLTVTEGDANTIKGSWDWKLQMGKSARVETGTFTIFRTSDGRSLVMNFDELNRRIERGETKDEMRGAPAWTFRKASKRLALWDELPF
jgi:hypothetical protein